MRPKAFIGLSILLLVPAGDEISQGMATPILSQRCTDCCTSPLSDITLRTSCLKLCDALEAQGEEPCIQALANSTDEHLTLLSYSSGQYIATAEILAGATQEATPEYLRFIQNLLLHDRGSPEACHAIDDAHYCLIQGSFTMSLGLCLPETCDSASVSRILANVSIISNDSACSNVGHGVSRVDAPCPTLGPFDVVCGSESRLDIDEGTVLTLDLVGCLLVLAAVGTVLDYQQTQGEAPSQSYTVRNNIQLPQTDYCRLASGTQGLLAAPISFDETSTPEDLEEPIAPVSASEMQEGKGTPVRHEIGPEKPAPVGTIVCDERFYPSKYPAGGGLESNEDTASAPLLGTNTPVLSLRQSPDSRRLRSTGGTRECVPSWWIQCLKCFSLRKNMDTLLAPPSSNAFGALDGLRTLSNLWIILLHVFLGQIGGGAGLTNKRQVLPIDGRGVLASVPGQVILGGPFAVDSFFLMSAFLTSVTLLPSLESGPLKGSSWVLRRYWRRYVRLMPTTAFVTLMIWQLFPLVSRGPTWWPFAKAVKDICGKYWWTEITFVQNLVPWPPQVFSCINLGWSLGVEMQCFLAAVPLIALYHHRPRVGVATLVTLMVASCIYTLWYAFENNIRFPVMYSSASDQERFIAYTSTWSRCPVYIIGLLCGMAWHEHLHGRALSSNHRALEGGAEDTFVAREKLSPPTAFILSALLMVLPVFGAFWANQDMFEVRIPAWLDHLYLAFSRPSWALGVALLCGLCFCGRGGVVNSFLTLPVWTPLSRLTYCFYLSHQALVQWLQNTRSVPYEYTALELMSTCVGMTGAAFVLSTVVYLLVEAPCRNLASWARKR